MKLLYIANARMPTEKAHGYQIMKMCEAFSQKGMEVELIVPWRFNSLKEDPFSFYGVQKIFKVRKVFSLDLINLLGSLGFLIQHLSFSEVATYYALFKKPGIIYSRDELPLFYLSFFYQFIFKKRKLYWESHSGKINFMARRALKKCDGLITVTGLLKEFYVNGFRVRPEKVLVSPDSVDLSVFDITLSKEEAREKLGLPKERTVLGYFGRFRTMEMEKGITSILEALKSLPENFIFLAVGGSKEDIGFYRKSIEEMKLSERVIFQGQEKREKVAIYQKACDILLMPFPDLPHYRYYMSPLKMFEYMASKRPIIASDLPSVREVLNENNAVLVPSDDSGALAKAIKDLTEDQALGERLSSKAFESVRNYTWDKRADKILAFIK